MSTVAPGRIFDSLPGIEVPVGRVAQSLDEIWADAPEGGAAAPSEFRASQMNLVLHLGMRTTLENAAEQFEVALALSRRHPARIVVLCPLQIDEGGTSMRAKVFSECHIGASGTEMVCCEAVMLNYPFDTRRFMENQVSTCLETDLPVYYWPHRIASAARLEDYSYLLKGARRIVIDTAIEHPDVALTLSTLGPRVRDLADARLLQVRQSLGRFISGFHPAALVDGLTSAVVACDPGHAAEGRRLLAWVKQSLSACGAGAEVAFKNIARDDGPGLSLELGYTQEGRGLKWEAAFDTGHACMRANLGAGEVHAEGPVLLLKPEVALAEAIFS